MGRRPRGFEAAALIDGHIDQNRSRLHILKHVARHEFRGFRTGNQHRADHQVGGLELFADVVFRRHKRFYVLGHHVRQVGQTLEGDVADRHVGTQAGRHTCRRRAYDTGSDHEYLGGLHARHAAQQLPFSAVRFFEEVTTLLRRHTPCDFRHGNQQRQRTVGCFDGFVSAADRTTFDHCPGQRFAAGEVKIGEYQLSLADEFVFRLYRLLDLDDHFGFGIDLFDGRQQFGACGDVVFVRESAVCTGSRLHIHFMPTFGKLFGSGRGERNPVFVVFDLFWNTDNHKSSRF